MIKPVLACLVLMAAVTIIAVLSYFRIRFLRKTGRPLEYESIWMFAGFWMPLIADLILAIGINDFTLRGSGRAALANDWTALSVGCVDVCISLLVYVALFVHWTLKQPIIQPGDMSPDSGGLMQRAMSRQKWFTSATVIGCCAALSLATAAWLFAWLSHH